MSKSGEFKTAIAPGDNGILTINNTAPDSLGNFQLTSSDGSLTITPIANGQDVTVTNPAPPLAATHHFIYVDSASGSNVTGTGTAINPFQTLTFAMASVTGNSATSLFCLFALGVFNESVSIKPFTTILGTGTKTTQINGTLSLAASWNTVNGTFSLINLYVQAINFNSSGFASGTVSLYASNILQGATSTDNFSLNAGTNTGFIEIRNSSLSGSWILRDYTLTGLYVDFFVFDYDRPNGSGGIFSFLYNSICAAGSPVPSISSSGGATLFFILRNTAFDALAINSNVQLTYDVNSYPTNGFTFGGTGTAQQSICSPGIIPHTTVNTTTYTVLDSDYYLACGAAAPIALTFPAATGSGRTIVIKNTGGDAATFAITVTSAGATFDGISPLVINKNYGSVTCTDVFANIWSLTQTEYKFPQAAYIIMRARIAQAVTNAVLSSVQFAQVDRGTAYLSGSPLSAFTCPYAGDYVVTMTSWNCGGGNGDIRCTSTRSGTPVYNQTMSVSNGCYMGEINFPVLNCVSGDIITLQANENNTGSLVTSITDTTVQGQGSCTITFYPNT